MDSEQGQAERKNVKLNHIGKILTQDAPKKMSGLCVDISWQKGRLRETSFFEFSSSLCLTARVTKATFSHFWVSTVFHTGKSKTKRELWKQSQLCQYTPRLTSLRKRVLQINLPHYSTCTAVEGRARRVWGREEGGLVQRGGPARTGTWPPGQPCQGPQASLFQSPQRMRNDHWPNIISRVNPNWVIEIHGSSLPSNRPRRNDIVLIVLRFRRKLEVRK